MRRYPAEHYVVVDDKLRILAAIKEAWSDRVTTVFPKQGKFANDPKVRASYPSADVTVDRTQRPAFIRFTRPARGLTMARTAGNNLIGETNMRIGIGKRRRGDARDNSQELHERSESRLRSRHSALYRAARYRGSRAERRHAPACCRQGFINTAGSLDPTLSVKLMDLVKKWLSAFSCGHKR